MNLDRWEEVKQNLTERFEVAQAFEESFEFMGGQAVRDVLELKTAMGRLRVSLETRPVVAGKEFHYSHRPGASAHTEFILSEDEVVHHFKVEKENDDGDWEEMSANGLVD